MPLSTQATYQPGQDRITVWVIEDDRLFRQTVVKLLEDVPDILKTASFSHCEAALDRLAQGFTPDVVLMDLGLPGMGGIEGIQRIKSSSPSSHLIVLTVHEDNDKIFKAVCAGASGYLLKPSSRMHILQAIEAARHGGASMNPQIAGKMLHMFAEMALPKDTYTLTDREREILTLMAQDQNKPAIAEQLCLSYHTIDMHVRNIYAKLHVHTATGAIAKAVKERLI
jgi:DNA-binding NarL/FixJ family response regulator